MSQKCSEESFYEIFKRQARVEHARHLNLASNASSKADSLSLKCVLTLLPRYCQPFHDFIINDDNWFLTFFNSHMCSLRQMFDAYHVILHGVKNTICRLKVD